VDETALAHDAQEVGFEGGHFSFPESTGRQAPAWQV
jgi:hypothetical protein